MEGSRQRKKLEKEKYNRLTGWEPTPYEEDYGISIWMKWQYDGCFKKRRPTEVDEYRNLPTGRCHQIENVSSFENESLSERFRQKKRQQVDGKKLLQEECVSVGRISVSEKQKDVDATKEQFRQCKSASAQLSNTEIVSANVSNGKSKVVKLNKSTAAANVNKSTTTVTRNKKDKVLDEDEDVNDDGYGSKTSGTDDVENGTDIRPVPLLDLIGVSPEDESQVERTQSFRWLREKEKGGNNKITKLSFAQGENPGSKSSANRNDIINNSKAFVTDYIKRCHPQSTKAQSSSEQRPKSLNLSRVGVQDSNATAQTEGNIMRSSSVISKTNPELNVSNLVTESFPNRCSSRQTYSRVGSRAGNYRTMDNKRNPAGESERQSVPCFPMKDLLPAVDQNIHTKQQERYTKHSVEEYYGKIGCGNQSDYNELSGMEALSRSLDKHIGPPAFRPHYLRSPLQRAREQNNKRSLGKLKNDSDAYKICTPRFYVDKTLSRRHGSADRTTRIKLCLFGSVAPKSAEPRRKSAQLSARASSERSVQEATVDKD